MLECQIFLTPEKSIVIQFFAVITINSFHAFGRVFHPFFESDSHNLLVFVWVVNNDSSVICKYSNNAPKIQ